MSFKTSSTNRILRDRGEEQKHVNIHLHYEEKSVQHYCVFCRTGIFRSQYRAITIDYGVGAMTSEVLTSPISFQCHKCGTIYHIQILSDK